MAWAWAVAHTSLDSFRFRAGSFSRLRALFKKLCLQAPMAQCVCTGKMLLRLLADGQRMCRLASEANAAAVGRSAGDRHNALRSHLSLRLCMVATMLQNQITTPPPSPARTQLETSHINWGSWLGNADLRSTNAERTKAG